MMLATDGGTDVDRVAFVNGTMTITFAGSVDKDSETMTTLGAGVVIITAAGTLTTTTIVAHGTSATPGDRHNLQNTT